MNLDELNAALANLTEAELLSLPALAAWAERNVQHVRVDALPEEFAGNEGFDHWRVLVVNRGGGQWGVRDLSQDHLLMRDGTWRSFPIETEEIPQSRYTLPEAVAAGRAASAKITGVNKMSLSEHLAWYRKRYAEN